MTTVTTMSSSRNVWQDWNSLWVHLGFESLKELEDFIQRENFAPFFEELSDAVIVPD